MLRSVLILVFLAGSSINLHAQDAALPEGQKAIQHRSRYFEGNPIRKFTAKNSISRLEAKKFSGVSSSIYEGVAYVGTDLDEVVTVTSSEINRKYKLENAGAIEGAPAITKDKVFVGFKNNLIAAFSREDGKLLWKYETKGPVTTPLVHGDMIYFTTSNGLCYALKEETGTFKWKFSILSKASSPAYVQGAGFENDLVIVGTERRQIYALSAKKGDKVWVHDGAGGQPVVGDIDIYAVEKIGSVVAIDKSDGRGLWHFRGDLVEGTTEFALAKNTIVFGNGSRIMALDSRMGEGFKWKRDLPQPLGSAPIIVGNVTYATCLDGKLYAFDLETGNEIDHFDLGFTPNASLSFCKDRLLLPNGEEILLIGGE